MNIRSKLMLAMASLIVFILLCLLAVTHIQFYIVRDFAYLKDKEIFESLQSEFERYYAEHGGSWEGVNNGSFEHSGHFAEIVLIVNDQALYRQGQLSVGALRSDGFPLMLEVDGQTIGRLKVMNSSQYKTYEFKMMWYDIVPVVAVVSLLIIGVIALITILLLSWRLTAPIRKIIHGINAIRAGSKDAAFPVKRKDEFGAISRALWDMNESLRNEEKSRKQLLSDVAHELKTPLMIIQGELELAQDTAALLTPEKQSSLLDEVYRLSRLVHDVLDLSRLEAGGAQLRPGAENIVEIVEGLVEKVSFLAEEKQIRLAAQFSEETIEVSVEKQRIVQALYNILANALHYTDNGGQVQIRVERSGPAPDQGSGFICITIEDNGIGIAEEELPYIFNRFYRADLSRTRPNGGTGLGLAIAQQNILAHRGTIEVRSKVGQGTVFTILLPSADAHRAINN